MARVCDDKARLLGDLGGSGGEEGKASASIK